MKVNKKIIAKEFIYLLIVILITLFTFISLFIRDIIIDKNILNLEKEIELHKELIFQLQETYTYKESNKKELHNKILIQTKKYKLWQLLKEQGIYYKSYYNFVHDFKIQESIKRLHTDLRKKRIDNKSYVEFNTNFFENTDELNQSAIDKDSLWSFLIEITQRKEIDSLYKLKWFKSYHNGLRQIKIHNAEDLSNFILSNNINKHDLNNIAEVNKIKVRINNIINKINKNNKQKFSTKKQLQISFQVLIFLFIFLFFIRYIIYATIWSLKILKE